MILHVAHDYCLSLTQFWFRFASKPMVILTTNRYITDQLTLSAGITRPLQGSDTSHSNRKPRQMTEQSDYMIFWAPHPSDEVAVYSSARTTENHTSRSATHQKRVKVATITMQSTVFLLLHYNDNWGMPRQSQ